MASAQNSRKTIARLRAAAAIILLTVLAGFCIAVTAILMLMRAFEGAYAVVALFLVLILLSNLFTKIALYALDIFPARN